MSRFANMRSAIARSTMKKPSKAYCVAYQKAAWEMLTNEQRSKAFDAAMSLSCLSIGDIGADRRYIFETKDDAFLFASIVQDSLGMKPLRFLKASLDSGAVSTSRSERAEYRKMRFADDR